MSNQYTADEVALLREISRLRGLVRYQGKVLEMVNEWFNKTDAIKPNCDISGIRDIVKESVS